MEPLVAAVVGAFALFVGYRRIAYVKASFQRREQLDQFEKALRDAREHANGPSPWRMAAPQDRELIALLDAADGSVSRALSK